MPVLSLFSDSQIPKNVLISYAFDYVIIIIFIGAFSALDMAQPYNQPFSLNNDSLKYPYADPERISAAWAAVIAIAFPLLFVVIWTLLVDGFYSHQVPKSRRRLGGNEVWTMRDRLWEMNCAILGLGLSVAGSVVITGALKNTTGKPRPDIIARCMPKAGSENPKWGLVTSAICTQPDNHILKDGFKSWPSGHSSISFAGLGYLSLFLAGKLHVLDTRGEVWKTLTVLVPLLAASLVAVSRIMDARHHPFDVLTGAFIGILVAWASYRQYFPSITDTTKKGRAYKIRSWGTDQEMRMDPVYADENEASGALVSPEEEGKAGYIKPLSSATEGSAAAGGITERSTGSSGSNNGGRFSDESAALQARKREAQRTGGRTGPAYYNEEPDGYYEGAYELRSTTTQPSVARKNTAPVQSPYSPPSVAPQRKSIDVEDATIWGTGSAASKAGQQGPYETIMRTGSGFESVKETSPPVTRDESPAAAPQLQPSATGGVRKGVTLTDTYGV